MSDDHGHGHGHDDHDTTLARIEALSKENVHHAGDHEGPFSLHVLGLGAAGAAVVAEILADAPDGFTALAVNIGDEPLAAVRAAAGGSAAVTTVDLPIPSRAGLSASLNRYREFLKMEYPRYYWNPNYEPWLPGDLALPGPGEPVPRAIAKAIYNCEYYQNGEITRAMEDFAAGVLASDKTPVVVIPFSLGDSTASGIVVDLARHLSSIKLGRRPWVVGVGITPTEPSAEFFPVINELDCMIDTPKNQGVMAVWGDLYKNPFTGGFFSVPQPEGRDVAPGVAKFLAAGGGKDLYESLKALNWLAVPGDQWHPAIRGEQSDKWLNILTVTDLDDAGSLGDLGLTRGFSTEYAEARVFGSGKEATAAAKAVGPAISEVAATRVPPVVKTAPGAGFVSVVIPRATKLDLAAFVPSRDLYDPLEWDDKLLLHSWILDLGVMLCEPSIRFDGMGGECIWGCACWVVVPHAAIRGEVVETPVAVPEAVIVAGA
ncbi:hypothetical protein [Pseudonocardia hydrocarbonoxydans]|uniref:Uncharacterized protein n=1 Tax=Pseudonocardia hydrocarbonoxydans TaxID=76726 RepID=A0A4Y3WK18_9PSEU|nr:hypothetical protein [Pseudonocardia hydrocarbonoxydans]GEC18360.1 hypothetical protein PHY01_06430 [Pseudonocardia hydrocarbonoxydans]